MLFVVVFGELPTIPTLEPWMPLPEPLQALRPQPNGDNCAKPLTPVKSGGRYYQYGGEIVKPIIILSKNIKGLYSK